MFHCHCFISLNSLSSTLKCTENTDPLQMNERTIENNNSKWQTVTTTITTTTKYPKNVFGEKQQNKYRRLRHQRQQFMCLFNANVAGWHPHSPHHPTHSTSHHTTNPNPTPTPTPTSIPTGVACHALFADRWSLIADRWSFNRHAVSHAIANARRDPSSHWIVNGFYLFFLFFILFSLSLLSEISSWDLQKAGQLRSIDRLISVVNFLYLFCIFCRLSVSLNIVIKVNFIAR